MYAEWSWHGTGEFFQEDNPTFKTARQALDWRMKERTAEDVGVTSKSADPITVKNEEDIWQTGVFNVHSAVVLANLHSFLL